MIKNGLIIVFAMILLLTPVFVFAQTLGDCTYPNITASGGTTPTKRIELDPPFGQSGQSGDVFIQEIAGVIINWALGIVGSIALLMFVAGGFIWLTSAGSPDKIKLGKGIIVWSVLGLVIIFASYAISRFILQALLG